MENKPQAVKTALVLVDADLRLLNPNRLGMRVANALLQGCNVEVKLTDKILSGHMHDGIYVDEVIHELAFERFSGEDPNFCGPRSGGL